MKEDVEIRKEVPKKRKDLKNALDEELAVWASDESLPPSARNRAAAERLRRKLERKRQEVKVGVLVTSAGLSPEQYEKLGELLTALKPTEVHHPGLPSRVHQRIRTVCANIIVHDEPLGARQHVVKASDRMLIFVKDNTGQGDVWEHVKYAKHRNMPVQAILKSGEEA